MSEDKVFTSKSDLAFKGSPEETVQWLIRHGSETDYVRVGSTDEMLVRSEYLALYV